MNKIEITPELLGELKEKAEKTTPILWIANFGNPKQDVKAALDAGTTSDAEYIIATNPQLVLAMIAHIENLEKELDAARYSEANESGRVVRLERESDWLASRLQKFCDHTLVCMSCPCRLRGGCHNNNWRNAARKAVEDADDAMEAEQEARER